VLGDAPAALVLADHVCITQWALPTAEMPDAWAFFPTGYRLLASHRDLTREHCVGGNSTASAAFLRLWYL
jgi:hypothetical protein